MQFYNSMFAYKNTAMPIMPIKYYFICNAIIQNHMKKILLLMFCVVEKGILYY